MSALAPSHVDDLEDKEFDGTLPSFFSANPKHAKPFVDYCFTVAQEEGTRMDPRVMGKYMAQPSIAPDYQQHLQQFDKDDPLSKVTFEDVVGAAINSYAPEVNEPTEEPSSEAACSVATTGIESKKGRKPRRTMEDWIKVRPGKPSSLNGKRSLWSVFSTN